MRLTGKVTQTISGTEYVNKKRRVRLHIEEADMAWNSLQVPSEDLQLDDQVTVFLIPGEVQEIPTTYDQAMAIIDESVRRQQEANLDPQPDAPPVANGLHVVKGVGDAS